MLIFLPKKCICKSYSHFFIKNTCELDIVLTRTVHILTTNKLVKLTMLWTTGPRTFTITVIDIIVRPQTEWRQLLQCVSEGWARLLLSVIRPIAVQRGFLFLWLQIAHEPSTLFQCSFVIIYVSLMRYRTPTRLWYHILENFRIV